MSESKGGRGQPDASGTENGEEILIPKGREMTVAEEQRFLAWLFVESIGPDGRLVSRGSEAN